MSEGGGSLWAQILGGRGRRPQPLLVSKTIVFLLFHSEDHVILFSFVWIGYQRVTDRQTDGRRELPWLIQRSALQAMRPRYKNRRRGASVIVENKWGFWPRGSVLPSSGTHIRMYTIVVWMTQSLRPQTRSTSDWCARRTCVQQN